MFELQVVSNTPMTGVDDIDVLAETFLVQIGYLPKGYDPRSAGALSVRDSIPYRLFMDFFMKNPETTPSRQASPGSRPSRDSRERSST